MQPRAIPESNIPVQNYRDLEPFQFAEGSTVSKNLPFDTAIKRMLIRGTGYFRVNYPSGSPIVDEAAVSGRILQRIDVVLNGEDTIKSIDPVFMQKQQLLINGSLGERSVSTSASSFSGTTRVAGTEMAESGAPFAFPANAQYVLFNESFMLYFEHPHLYSGNTGARTLLYTKNLTSGYISMTFGTLSNLQQAASAPVAMTFDDFSIQYIVTLVENRSIIEDAKNPFWYFKETMMRPQFTGPANDSALDILTGGLLTGLHFIARSGGPTKEYSDKLVQKMRVVGDTTKTLANTSWLALQNENRINYGLRAPRASGKTPLTGYAYLPFVMNGMWSTALDTNNFKTLQLRVDTAPSSGIDAESYTNPAVLSVLLQELYPKNR